MAAVAHEARVPERLLADEAAEARWRERFSAARMSAPRWARDAPDRNIYLSNAGGTFEVYAWDRASEEHRQVTERPNGTAHAAISPDGETIWWFADTDGDEFGHWVAEPFAGGFPASAAEVPDGYPAGLEIGRTRSVIGASTDEGTTIWTAGDTGPRVLYTNPADAGVGALSRDETLLVVEHSEHGDSRHPALRALRARDGATVAELADGPGLGLAAIEFSPTAGDPRVLVGHERRGRDELLIWDPLAGTQSEIRLDLPGDVTAEFYPDATALLVVHNHAGRDELHRYDLDTAAPVALETPRGSIGGAGVRDEGSVEYSFSSGASPPEIRVKPASGHAGEDPVLVTPPGHRPAGSEPLSDVSVDGPGGPIPALLAHPEGAGTDPLPTVFLVHGGPQAADEDRFSAYRAVWLDAGFAVVHVNYRGSSGYGTAWRDAIEGRPGLTELADIAAVQDWAIEKGLCTPRTSVLNGASWGGYLALLALGTQPGRWAAGIAGVPVADYVAAYADEMEPLRAFDRSLFGGSPEERPEVYRRASPLTYADAVAAPLLVVAGENDPRCPLRQVENYLAALDDRGAAYEVYRYDAGHGSLVTAETIRQTAVEVYFAQRALELAPNGAGERLLWL
jgi:dipeptidyl aminopeptidase/acylaminoacyl peptidase